MHVPRNMAGGPSRPMFVARRRRRVRPMLLSVGLVAALVTWVGTDLSPWGGAESSTEPVAEQVQLAEDERRTVETSPATPPLASFGALELHLTTERPLIVGFHEASSREALEMAPTGRLTDNENTTKFEPPAQVDRGSDYLVMSSRGRPRPATSAVDVVMYAGDPVRSPVSGTVTDVRTYYLYGAHEDHRIEIAPHAQPDLRVVLIHIDELEVAAGDEVRAGESVLAGTARPFPFGSQVDRYTEPERHPHVHIEVKVEDDDGDGERGDALADGHDDVDADQDPEADPAG